MRMRSHLIALALGVTILSLVSPATALAATNSRPIDITPDEMEVWYAMPDHNKVGVIGAQGVNENMLITEIDVMLEPWSVAVHPSNGEVWVTCKRSDAIVIIDAATKTVIDTISDLGFDTYGVAFNPSGTKAAATASGSDDAFIIDVTTRNRDATLNLYRRPHGIAWADDTRFYVSTLLFVDVSNTRVTKVFQDTSAVWQKQEILVLQDGNIFAPGAGYPSCIISLNIQPAPADTFLILPATHINTLDGNLVGGALEATDITTSVLRPVNIRSDQSGFTEMSMTYKSSIVGTPTSGPIATEFHGGRMFVPNLSSGDITFLSGNIMTAVEDTVIRCGEGPLGAVVAPVLERIYVHNWLSRDITVISTAADTVVTTVNAATTEPYSASVLNGKQIFFSSRGNLSVDNRHSCHSCHVFGTADGRDWDLSQFGAHKRATPDMRAIALTGAHNWTASMDEMQDHEFGIRDLQFGPGLIPGLPNAKLGPPNAGLSADLDDMAEFMGTQTLRSDTPTLAPGEQLSATADSGRTLFFDSVVGCAGCHVPPYFTDSNLGNSPFVIHDVGTAAIGDSLGALGFDTPSLLGVWDTGPYFHHHAANSLKQTISPTALNPNDLHGVTSILNSDEIDFIVEYVKTIGGFEQVPTGVEDTSPSRPVSNASLGRAAPNPFHRVTSIDFSIPNGPADVQIEVYNVAGRKVRTLLRRQMTRGTHIVGWDALNDSGKDVGNGIYFARLYVDGEEQGSRKMTILR